MLRRAGVAGYVRGVAPWIPAIAMVVLAAIAAAAEPPVITMFYSEPEGDAALVTDMHGLLFDRPRLFARPAGWDIGLTGVLTHVHAAECALPHIVGLVLGDPAETAAEDRLQADEARVRRLYRSRPGAGLTDVDLAAIRACLAAAGWSLEVVPWGVQDSTYASSDLFRRVVRLPRSVLSGTGMCDRAVAIHEMTHFFQDTFGRGYTYSRIGNPGEETCELAAMIAETAERLRQGWDAGVLADNDMDRLPWLRFPDLYPDEDDAEAVAVPRLEGPLLASYLRLYGPRLDGIMAHDLDSLRDWTRRFEVVSRIMYPALPAYWRARWAALARAQVDAGLVDRLASVAQTWLAVNGMTSAYGFAMPASHPPDAYYPRQATDLREFLRALPSGLPEDRVNAARAFLERASGRRL